VRGRVMSVAVGVATALAPLEHGLIDEYSLWILPIVLGGGKRLFREGVTTSLELADSTTSGTGALLLTYRPTES